MGSVPVVVLEVLDEERLELAPVPDEHHAPVAWWVIPAICTRRVACSMKNNRHMCRSKVSTENAAALHRCLALPTSGVVGLFALVGDDFGVAGSSARRSRQRDSATDSHPRDVWARRCGGSLGKHSGGREQGAPPSLVGRRSCVTASPQVRSTIEFPAPTPCSLPAARAGQAPAFSLQIAR